jgi:hypothetical protein
MGIYCRETVPVKHPNIYCAKSPKYSPNRQSLKLKARTLSLSLFLSFPLESSQYNLISKNIGLLLQQHTSKSVVL